MKPRSRIIAVCSDQARNGKTLLARLIADYLVLAGRNPLIFDADSHGEGIRTWFAERAFPIDLSKTMGQIQLFDRILGLPFRDHVIDVPAAQFEKFIDTVAQIGFVAEARAHRFAVGVFYVVDRGETSLEAGKRARAALAADGFYPVRNAAVGDVTADGRALGVFKLLAQDGEMNLPAMAPELAAKAMKPGFSFARFLREERPAELTLRERQMMNTFLDAAMGQIDTLLTKLDEASARRLGPGE